MSNPWIPLGIVVAVALVEVWLSKTWNASYFATGVPIFLRRIDRPSGLGDVDLDVLQKRCATAAGAPILFRRLDANRIAFREQMAGGLIHYTPIMRGLIRHQREEASVVVAGLVKWYIVAAIVVLAVWLGKDIVHALPYVALAFGVLYLIQGVRFWRLANALRVNAP